jgi:hypothetical protein
MLLHCLQNSRRQAINTIREADRQARHLVVILIVLGIKRHTLSWRNAPIISLIIFCCSKINIKNKLCAARPLPLLFIQSKYSLFLHLLSISLNNSLFSSLRACENNLQFSISLIRRCFSELNIELVAKAAKIAHSHNVQSV